MNLDRKYLAAGVLIACGAILAFWGYLELLQQAPYSMGGVYLWYESLLLTAQLILNPFSGTLGGPPAVKDLPWQLIGARVLMPIAMVSGLALVFFQAFRRYWRAIGARFASGHVVICTSGERAFHLASYLAGEKHGAGVVVIDMEASDPAAEQYHGLGVAVLSGGKPVTEQLLRSAGVRRAAALICLCKDDLLNVEIVLKAKLKSARVRSASRGPLVARAAVADPDLRQACSLMLIDRSAQFEYGLISIQRNVVRQLLFDHPLDEDPGFKRGERTHVMIVGFGETGQALALEIARGAHFADGRVPAITVVDREATEGVAAMLHQHHGLNHAADLRPIDYNLREDGLDVMETAMQEAPPTRVVLCLGNEGLGLSAAARTHRLAARLGMADLPVFVRLSQAPEIAHAIAVPSVRPSFKNIIPFGQPNAIFTREIILEESLDRLAHAVHDTYLQMVGGVDPNRPAAQSWENLSETYREASRHQADHIPPKLRAAGCELVRGTKPNGFTFTGDEVERLARMEHARWCAERYIAGWRYAPARNDAALEHPSLLDWDVLSESERQKDRDMVLGLPKMVATAGYGIRRIVG